MRTHWYVAGAGLVAALSFSLGWLVRPGIRFTDFPEVRSLRATGGCAPLPAPSSVVEDSLRYSPGDSARVQVLVMRRTGSRGTLLTLKSDLPDDEVDAEGREYEMEWTKQGWTLVGCRSVVRYQPGRP